jgi:hypothetical protein
MSKLSFRARAIDANKPMPVFKHEEIPELLDFTAVNRAVLEMPTGMEKEEETVCVGSPCVNEFAQPSPSLMSSSRNRTMEYLHEI